MYENCHIIFKGLCFNSLFNRPLAKRKKCGQCDGCLAVDCGVLVVLAARRRMHAEEMYWECK